MKVIVKRSIIVLVSVILSVSLCEMLLIMDKIHKKCLPEVENIEYGDKYIPYKQLTDNETYTSNVKYHLGNIRGYCGFVNLRNKYTKTHLDKDGIEILIERSEGGLSILGYIGVYLVFNNGKCTGYRSRDNSRLYRFNIKNKDCEMLVESGKHILSHNPAIPLGDELYDAPTYSIMISDNHNTFEMIVSMRIANILYKSCIKENYNESDCKDYYVIDKIWKYYDDNYLSTISDFTMKIGALSESECESLFEGADP